MYKPLHPPLSSEKKKELWFTAYANSELCKRPTSKGAEGKCPVCCGPNEGDDRFSICPNGVLYCRKCDPSRKNKKAYHKIAKELDRLAGIAKPPPRKIEKSNPASRGSHPYQFDSAGNAILRKMGKSGGWQHWTGQTWEKGMDTHKLNDQIYNRPTEWPKTVIILEGEKDVDTVREHFHHLDPAYISGPGGAPFVNLPWEEMSACESIRVFYDADDAGRTGAKKCAEAAKRALPHVSVRYYAGPDVEGKKGYDVSDAFQEGGRAGVIAWFHRHYKNEIEVKEAPPEPVGLTNQVEIPIGCTDTEDLSASCEPEAYIVMHNVYQDVLRYDHERDQWFILYDPSKSAIWEKIPETQVRTLVQQEMHDRWEGDKINGLRRQSVANNIVSNLKGHTDISRASTEFDADTRYIGAQTCVIDTHTGESLTPTKFASHFLVTKQLSCDPAPEGGVPKRWLEFLHQCTGGDQDLIQWLRRFGAFCLLGKPRKNVFVCLWSNQLG